MSRLENNRLESRYHSFILEFPQFHIQAVFWRQRMFRVNNQMHSYSVAWTASSISLRKFRNEWVRPEMVLNECCSSSYVSRLVSRERLWSNSLKSRVWRTTLRRLWLNWSFGWHIPYGTQTPQHVYFQEAQIKHKFVVKSVLRQRSNWNFGFPVSTFLRLPRQVIVFWKAQITH